MQLELSLQFSKADFKDFKYSEGFNCIFPLLLRVGGWVGGLSETGNKANFSFSLS